MELQQIRYVVALSQELNFLRASRKVHVSQPTLSQQIKKLERELGTVLFERSSQHVRLTPEGERFLPYALTVLETLQKGIDVLREESAEIRGHVRLAAIPTIGPYVLPEVIGAIHKKAPLLTLELFEETTSRLLQSLREGRFDLGVAALPVPDSGIASKEIGEEEFYLATSKSHPFAKRKKVRAGDLKDQRLLILQEGHCFGEQALEYCRRVRTDEAVTFQGSSLASVMNLASAGGGVTFVPFLALETKSNPGLSFIRLSEPRPARKLGLVWRLSSPLNRAQRLVMEVVEKVVAKKLRK